MVRRLLSALMLALLALPVIAQLSPEAQRRYDTEFKKGYDALVGGKLEDGIASMKRCIEIKPEDPLCAYNLACAYSLMNQPDPAIEWFTKSIDWGGGYSRVFVSADGRDDVAQAEKDTDLDNIRKDPRFEAQMTRMREYKKKFEDFIQSPAVYVPDAIAKAPEIPVLIVLHAQGSTKEQVISGPWKKVADEMGYALIAPSGRQPLKRDPKLGMAWYPSLQAYANPQQSYQYDKTVGAAVDAFKKDHKVDRTRVFLVGEGQGAYVAMRLGLSSPGQYKGVVACDASYVEPLLKDKVASAAKAGFKLKILVDADALGRDLTKDVKAGTDAKDADPKAAASAKVEEWSKALASLGMSNAVGAFTRDPKDTEQIAKLAAAELKSMQPATAEASAPK